MGKKKQTPLKLWRQQYAEISFMIRQAKQARKGGVIGFKQPQAQRLAHGLKGTAHLMMRQRDNFARATAQQWAKDNAKRQSIPNTTDPAEKVSA